MIIRALGMDERHFSSFEVMGSALLCLHISIDHCTAAYATIDLLDIDCFFHYMCEVARFSNLVMVRGVGSESYSSTVPPRKYGAQARVLVPSKIV